MTSPTRQTRPSVRDRLSGMFSSGSSRRSHDPEARFTRNVTIAFVAIIVATIVIVLVAFAYAFWEANLKPLASVNGTEIGRGAWEERQRLEAFRADRADDATRAALAAGDIDEELANRRLSETTEIRNAGPSAAMENLVRLTHQSQLAEERGITLSDDELAAALAADGTFPEVRRIGAIVVQPSGGAAGQATPDDYAEARARAQEAHAALVAGTPVADLVEEYSPATAAQQGDLGYAKLEDLQNIDPVWAAQLWDLDEGGIGDIVEAENGDQLIGVVTTIVPELPDSGFLSAVNDQVGEDVHRRHVELEATATKLEEAIVAEAVEGDFDQVRLAEIVVAGDPFADPEQDEGTIRASHILYQPETAEAEASPLPDSSPLPGASSLPSASTAPGASAAPDASTGASALPSAVAASAGPASTVEPAVVTSEASPLPSLSADLLIASTVAMSALSEPEAAAEASASPAPSLATAPTSPSIPAASAAPSATPTAAPSVEPTSAASPEPGASPSASADPEEEAAWAAALVKAEATAAELRAITDVAARMETFAELAARDGTDATAQNGGDLGFFERGDMVPEFADALFDAEGLQQGDIIGPVRSEFGWHVIMFDDKRAPLADRLAAVEEALAAPDADFATVARELSDGPTAEQGGEIGWRVADRLDDLVRMAVTVVDVGQHSQAIDGERGYSFYQKLEEATRPLDPAEAARIAPSAFSEWYDEQRFQAEDDGRINIDDSVYDEAEGVTLDG